jgi:hypothetical protein
MIVRPYDYDDRGCAAYLFVPSRSLPTSRRNPPTWNVSWRSTAVVKR